VGEFTFKGVLFVVSYELKVFIVLFACSVRFVCDLFVICMYYGCYGHFVGVSYVVCCFCRDVRLYIRLNGYKSAKKRQFKTK